MRMSKLLAVTLGLSVIVGALWGGWEALSRSRERVSASSVNTADTPRIVPLPDAGIVVSQVSRDELQSLSADLPLTRSVECKVSACGGGGLPDCRVSILREEAGASIEVCSNSTGEHGLAQLSFDDALDGAQFLVVAEKSGWRSSIKRLGSSTVSIELHPALSVEVSVVTEAGQPIEGAMVQSRVWRELGVEVSEALGRVSARGFEKTDASGRASVSLCANEDSAIRVSALGFVTTTLQVNSDRPERYLVAKLNALLVLPYEEPMTASGKSARGLGTVMCQYGTAQQFKAANLMSVDERQMILEAVRDRTQNASVQCILYSEIDPAAYPPSVAYSYNVAGAEGVRSGDVRLRRLSDLGPSDVIRPASAINDAELGEVRVRFTAASRRDQLPRGYWGLVSKLNPLSWNLASSLPADCIPDYQHGCEEYRFRVASGLYFIACMKMGLEGSQFKQIPVQVDSGKTAFIEIDDYVPSEYGRVRIVAKTHDGLLVENLHVALERIVGRDERGGYLAGDNIGFQTSSFPDGYDVPYGEYYLTAGLDDGQTTGVLTVKSSYQEYCVTLKSLPVRPSKR